MPNSPHISDILRTLSSTNVSEINYVDTVRMILEVIESRRMFYYDDLLTLLYRLNGKPFDLRNHFYMRSLFSRVIPPQMTYKCGRQVAKSQSNGVHSCTMCVSTPFFNVLHVTPLYEMVHKFSVNVVAPLIKESPLRGMFVTPKERQAVLQRSLKNGSNMIFTFAFNDCTRVRGNTAAMIKYDEYQDFDSSFEPIINEVLSASSAGLDTSDEEAVKNENVPGIMRFGTPLTLENGLETMWQESSQAEWAILCRSCKHLNIASLAHDLEKMMGPFHRNEPITPQTPGIVCAKCGKYIYTRDGRWLHGVPERRVTHAGYHVPQAIVPFICESHKQWQILQSKRMNRNKMTIAQFYNECCGESYDHGAKLVSVTDLKNAAKLPSRFEIKILQERIKAGRYVEVGLGVDWGGGGLSGISKTAIAAGGLRADGIVEIFFGHRSDTPNAHDLEAKKVMEIYRLFNASFVAMDWQSDGGALRRSYQIAAGLPPNKALPMRYARIGQGAIIKPIPQVQDIASHLQINKAKSFLALSHLIRSEMVLFFEYDFMSRENPGLLNDFTSLAEERIPIKRAGDVYTIVHVPAIGPDDFAEAVNYLVWGLFHRRGRLPDLGAILTAADLTDEQDERVRGTYNLDQLDWLFNDYEY